MDGLMYHYALTMPLPSCCNVCCIHCIGCKTKILCMLPITNGQNSPIEMEHNLLYTLPFLLRNRAAHLLPSLLSLPKLCGQLIYLSHCASEMLWAMYCYVQFLHRNRVDNLLPCPISTPKWSWWDIDMWNFYSEMGVAQNPTPHCNKEIGVEINFHCNFRLARALKC